MKQQLPESDRPLQVGKTDGKLILPPEPSIIPPNDPYDLTRLRLSQDFEVGLGVKKIIMVVPVRKPHRQTFVRVHPDPSYRLETAIFEDKEDEQSYLVGPNLRSELLHEYALKVLFTTITRQGSIFLWPIRLPGINGKIDDYNKSALQAAHLAVKKWVRVAANRALGAYDVYESEKKIPDPEWPEIGFQDLIRIAFKDRLVDTPDHPILKKLRGEG